MTEQTIVAVYDTPAHAELAVQDLLQAGVPESAIHRHAREGSYAGRVGEPVARTTEGTGFWASLFGGEPDHDVQVYDRSVEAGANAVTVRASDEHVDRVMQILESHDPVDIDERAGSYGLTRPAAPTLAPTPAPTPARASAQTDVDTGVHADFGARGDQTLALSEETLSVGKRVVNRGTTRIRRFVVETPVEEQVRLRDERVTIERRPVTDSRPAAADSFGEKVVEVTETTEEPVVSKSARVREEIAIRKEVADRTETVRDTVRREEVEIEKPTTGALPGARR